MGVKIWTPRLGGGSRRRPTRPLLILRRSSRRRRRRRARVPAVTVDHLGRIAGRLGPLAGVAAMRAATIAAAG